MTSINKIILLGRVDAMPVYQLLPSGKKVVKLSVTTDGEESGERHRVLLYGKAGEYALKNLQPDMLVYIEGRIQYRQHVSRNGIRHEKTNIITHRMQLISRDKGEQQDKPFREGIRLDSNRKEGGTRDAAKPPALLMAPPAGESLTGTGGPRQG